MSAGAVNIVEMRLAVKCALLLVGAVHAPAANASKATARVSAQIVFPGSASVAVATKMLFSNSPGVLTLRIPGAAPAATITLTATAVDGSSGAIVFNAPRENAGALQQLVSEITAIAEAAASSGPQVNGLVTSGTIRNQGVQVVVVKATQGSDGGGTVIAIISYD